MSEAEERLSSIEFNENTSGVVLGYWDHEETPTLIQDLEQSVSLVELKCKKLLEELKAYKKYLEKPEEVQLHFTISKKKIRKSKKSPFFTGSEPEIAFRKNFVNFQKKKLVFEEKFQEKLENINKQLTEAAHKIGLKESIILFPTKDYLERLKEQAEDEEDLEPGNKEEEGDAKERFIELGTFKAKTKTKSDSVIVINKNSEDSDFSKITKNQLKLYQKLSKLSIKKRWKNKLKFKSFRRKKVTFFCKKRNLKYRRAFLTTKDAPEKHKPGKKSSKKRKSRAEVLRPTKSGDSNATTRFRNPETVNVCEFVGVAKGPSKSCVGATKREIEGSPSLRKSLPPATSTFTSSSNVQQVVPLPKHGKAAVVRFSASEKMHEGSLNSKPSAADVKKRHSIRWTQMKSTGFKSEETIGNSWSSERGSSSNFRKARSKNTERSLNASIKNLKSTTERLKNGQESTIQCKSKAVYIEDSKIMFSDCQRTDIFEVRKNYNSFNNASGDGKGNNKSEKLSKEWAQIYTSFLKMYRRYTCLKEKESLTDFAFSNELESLEKDIDYSIEKYKGFLQFYAKVGMRISSGSSIDVVSVTN